jgi:hypothetical protein
MFLIFIRVKRTFLLFFFDLKLNLAINKQRKRDNKERVSEQKTSENEKTEKERANKERANRRVKERLKRASDYKRMQF